MDLVLTGARQSDGVLIDIGVRDGLIVAVALAGTLSVADAQVVDARGHLVLPGLVDPHVHFTTLFGHEESTVFEQETLAAAAGGVTTVGDYPIGVAGSLLEDLDRLRRIISDHASVDVAIAYPILAKEQLAELDALYDAGVTTYKVMRAYRPPDVYAFSGIDDSLLYRAMIKVAEMAKSGKNVLLKVHCENVDLFKVYKEDLQSQYPDLGRDSPLETITWAHCRPSIVEAESVASALYLAEATGCPLMIVHLSSAMSLGPIREAKRRGVNVIVETTPLYLESDAYGTGAPGGPYWTRVQPSVKFAEDSGALWDALKDGTIDLIGTDHAPSPKSAYVGKSVWDHGASGRSLLAISLPLLLTAAPKHDYPISSLVASMTSAPAAALGVGNRKGRIAVGHDADLVLCDLNESRAITVGDLHSVADHTPFEGREVVGWPRMTMLRGAVVWSDGTSGVLNHGQFVGGA